MLEELELKRIERSLIGEKKRTSKLGLITKIEINDFIEDSIGWWKNKSKDGILRDPYSGLIINEDDMKSKLAIEHIIPVTSGGGTILFNLLPARTDINLNKQAKDPIVWWMNSSYWDEERFKDFVEYIFYAYDKVIEKYGVKFKDLQVNNSFGFLSEEELIDAYNTSDVDLSITTKEYLEEEREQAKEVGIISYEQFLSSIVTILSNIDKEKSIYYFNKIKEYEVKDLFKNITKYQICQKAVFDSIKDLDSSSKYLITKRVNISELMNNVDFNNPKGDIDNRIVFLDNLLQNNNINISVNSYISMIPNILIFTPKQLIDRLNFIINLNLSNDNIFTIIKNNRFLINETENEILSILENYRNTLSQEQFEIMINTPLQLEDFDVVKYIILSQSMDELVDSIKNRKVISGFKGSFKSSLNKKLKNKSSTYGENSKVILSPSIITGGLYGRIDFEKEEVTEVELKKIVKEVIDETDEEYIDSLGLKGENILEKRNNLIKI